MAFKNELLVVVARARNLPVMDRLALAHGRGGSTDPFCDVEFDGDEARTSVKRGTLAPGKQRVATVVNYVGDFLQVDAGGILADIDAPDEEDFSEGDRIMVRIESVDEAALTATLSYVSLDALGDGSEE